MWIIVSTLCLFNLCQYKVETDISYFSIESCQAAMDKITTVEGVYTLECINLVEESVELF